MKSIKLWCILALILILLPAVDGFSCASVMAAKNGMVLASHNEDGDGLSTQVNFIPAAKGRFGCLYISWGYSWPAGGMNDQGLFIHGNSVSPTGWRADPTKPDFAGNPRLHILQNCATVADVRRFFETYNVPLLNDRHFPVADRRGAAMVVEYAQGSVRFVTEKTWYQVSTNFLRTDYPGTEVPCDRFRIARQMLDSAGELSVPLIRSVLSATHAEGDNSTVFSDIFDLQAGCAYIYNFHNFEEVIVFNLAEELKKGARTIDLASLFSVKPFAVSQFRDRQPKPSYSILSGFYDRYGAAAALTRYEEMCRATRLMSYYDIGDEQIGRLASEMLRRGDTQAALDFYTSLSRNYPDSWQAYAGIGRVEMTLGHKAEAVAAFRRSLALDPDNPWVADMMKGLEKELGEQTKLMGKDSAALTKETPPSVLLPIPNRSQEPDAPDLAWDAETCIQMGMAYFKKEVSQKAICAAGKPLKSSLNGYEIDPALEALGVESFSWDWRNRDVNQFLAWIKASLAKGYPVLCGIKMNPTQHPEWSIDQFVLVVGYNEGGLFIDTNINGDGRILVTYSQLASLINRYSFENKDHRYFGRAFLGVKDFGFSIQSQEQAKNVVPSPAVGKPVPELKPVAVDSSKLKRLTGRYTTGGQVRIITSDGEKIFSHKEGREIYSLIPISETEFRFAGYEDRLRFELVSDKVIGVYHREADNIPEEPMQKRVEPIKDKNPEVMALIQQRIHEAMEGILKLEMFTPSLAAQIFPEPVKEAGVFFKWLGPQTGIDLYEREEQEGGCRYLYRLSYGNRIVALHLSVQKDKRISAVDYYLE